MGSLSTGGSLSRGVSGGSLSGGGGSLPAGGESLSGGGGSLPGGGRSLPGGRGDLCLGGLCQGDPVNRITDMCKNIAFPQLRCGR